MQDLGSNPTMAKAGQVWPPSPLVHICISHCLQLPPSQICCLAPQIWYAGRICTEAAPELAIPEHTYSNAHTAGSYVQRILLEASYFHD